MKIIIKIILALSIGLNFFLIYRELQSDTGDSKFVKEDNSLLSPTKKYELSRYNLNDKYDVPGYSFVIRNIHEPKKSFICTDYFRANDRFFLLWGEKEDIVWIYSGDTGTFFWKYNPIQKNWEKHAAIDRKTNTPPIPNLLKQQFSDSQSRFFKEKGNWN